ncbi:alpha/beta fold hydrolase [Ramlibacter sp.]|uniref:alpha/beta fold hydrolase n=1 Tax=Ramlibacter sp. TaxID=1917967 RepID=UPI003D0CAA17
MTTWVLLRGLAREAGHWSGTVRALRARVPEDDHVVAFSLPGNGELHHLESPCTVDGMVDSVLDRLDLRQCRPPFLPVALSLGGMVAMRWAERRPHQLSGCVLINASFAGLSPFWQRLRPASYLALAGLLRPGLRDDERERAVLALTSNKPVDETTVRAWTALFEARPVTRANFLRQLRAAAAYRLPQQRPDVPMLLLASSNDRLVAPECSRALARAWSLPLHLHSQTGHDLPLDDADWLIEHLLVFRAGFA